MRSPARTILVLALGSLVAACGAAATTSPAPTRTPTQAATDTPAPTEAATARPTPTPNPTTDGTGPEYVTGTSSLTVVKAGVETRVGGVTQLRGQVMTSIESMNDARVTGTGHITLNLDMQGQVAAEWGTTRLETADGAWEGQWTGASWNGSGTAVSGWLIGSGAYSGYTYYFHAYGPSQPYQVEGIIFEGSPPTP